MATGLYGRVAARGFPTPAAQADDPDTVAQGALESQGSWADPAHGENTFGPAPSTLPGFQADTVGDVGVSVRGDLPGPGALLDPDQTPGYGPGEFRSHASPAPGFAGSYGDAEGLEALHARSRSMHAQNFGGRLLQDYAGVVAPGATELPQDPSGTEDYGASNQAPLTGAARVLGGYDAVQGYGGGGDGPGGINANGYSAVRANRKGITGNVVNAFLNPSERPFMVPQAGGSFIPTDAVTGPEPFTSALAGDGLAYHDPSAYGAPPEPAALEQPLTAATAWGW